MIARAPGLAAIVAVLAACAPQRVPGHAPSLTVAGTELVLTTRDGRELRSAVLIGASLVIGAHTVRLDGLERDPDARDVLRHRFVVVGPGGEASPLCEPDAAGERWAIPLLDDHGQLQLVCSSGAIAKCVRWGYPPWQRDAAGPPARALHEACVRMVRADYGGTGDSATRDGTRIEYCDRSHPCPADDRRLEAVWSPGGAICVVRPRVPALMTLDELARRHPRLVGHLGPQACTVASAGADSAVLFSFFVGRTSP